MSAHKRLRWVRSARFSKTLDFLKRSLFKPGTSCTVSRVSKNPLGHKATSMHIRCNARRSACSSAASTCELVASWWRVGGGDGAWLWNEQARGRHGATPGPCEPTRHWSRAMWPPSSRGGQAGPGRVAPAATVSCRTCCLAALRQVLTATWRWLENLLKPGGCYMLHVAPPPVFTRQWCV